MSVFKMSTVFVMPALMGMLMTPNLAEADTIVVGGAVCKKNGSGTPADPNVYYDTSGVYNNTVSASAGVHFTCPVHRPDALDTTDITNAYARVRDERSDSVISCWLISCNSMGTSCLSGSLASTSSSGTGDYSLSLGSIGTFSGGFASVFCSLPGRSSSSAAASRITSLRYTD